MTCSEILTQKFHLYRLQNTANTNKYFLFTRENLKLLRHFQRDKRYHYHRAFTEDKISPVRSGSRLIIRLSS